MTQDQADSKFSCWAIVDVMGHQRFAGHVTEQIIAGQGFIRIDIPATKEKPAHTRIFGTASIYSISPVSESVAKRCAMRDETAPLLPYEIQELREMSVPAAGLLPFDGIDTPI